MDIGLFIVILIVMYVVPEIMKRLKPRKPYQYPEFPPSLPTDRREAPGIPGELSRGMKPPPLSQTFSGEGLPGDEGDPLWVMPGAHIVPEIKKFEEEQAVGLPGIANGAAMGIIWAEIIAPPVTMRPMRLGIRRI